MIVDEYLTEISGGKNLLTATGFKPTTLEANLLSNTDSGYSLIDSHFWGSKSLSIFCFIPNPRISSQCCQMARLGFIFPTTGIRTHITGTFEGRSTDLVATAPQLNLSMSLLLGAKS